MCLDTYWTGLLPAWPPFSDDQLGKKKNRDHVSGLLVEFIIQRQSHLATPTKILFVSRSSHLILQVLSRNNIKVFNTAFDLVEFNGLTISIPRSLSTPKKQTSSALYTRKHTWKLREAMSSLQIARTSSLPITISISSQPDRFFEVEEAFESLCICQYLQ